MDINGAIVEESNLTFAIVTVKPFVMENKEFADKIVARCSTINDFLGMPIVLACQESRDQFIYKGRKDIVENLVKINPAQIPWARYSFP